MSLLQKRLSGPTQISTVSAVAYTVPINTTTIVKQILLTNTTGSARTATIRLKPLNVTEANTHDILSNITVNANETVSFNCSMVLINNGNIASNTSSDQITFLCSANSALNVTIFGIEETE
jgi:hypothetical protein